MSPYDSTLEDIKDRIDIIDLVSEYVHLKKAGQNWKGLCPFHTEKTPSFTVSPSKQIFHCFGCGVGGDIFTFMVRYENMDFPEALNFLARKAGVELKKSGKSAMKTGEKEQLLNVQREAMDFFRNSISKAPGAGSYLKGRDIDAGTEKLFAIGYAPKSWNALLTHLGRKGYKPEIIKKAGLATQGSKGIYDTFRDRIIFPIYDLKGDIVAFGGRSIDGSEPKYLNSPETPVFNKRRVLYGLNYAKDAIKKKGYVFVMEGYMDVISAHVHGFENAVAPLGTAITEEHGKLIKRFSDNVILLFDSDQAGVKATKNAAAILFECGLNIKVLAFPEKEDPDSFLRKRGKAAFEDLLRRPLTIIEFIMGQEGEKRVLAREALGIISKVSDRILQGEYIRMLSEKLNISENLVLEQMKKVRSAPSSRDKGGPSAEPARKKRPPALEVYIIKLVLQVPEMVSRITGEVKDDDLSSDTIKSIFRKITKGVTEFNDLLEKADGDEKDLLTEISMSPDLENTEKILSDCLKRLKDNRFKKLTHELDRKIKLAEQKGDISLLNELQGEKVRLIMLRKSEKSGS